MSESLLDLGTTQTRCLCGKWTTSASMSYSGVLNYTARLCAECEKTYAEMARVVCIGCRRLQGFMPPQKTPVGFRFESGKCYHISKCPNCSKDAFHTDVLEYASWMRSNGIPYRTDEDLVQEVEQKRLRISADAPRLLAQAEDANTSHERALHNTDGRL